MKQNGVARYLKEAPLRHIWGHADYGNEDPRTCFPTYSEYMARPWNVYGQAASAVDGEYHVNVNNLFMFAVYSQSPRFKKFFEILGPMPGIMKRVPPLPGDIVDEEFIHPSLRR
jgi:hypothetical protein